MTQSLYDLVTHPIIYFDPDDHPVTNKAFKERFRFPEGFSGVRGCTAGDVVELPVITLLDKEISSFWACQGGESGPVLTLLRVENAVKADDIAHRASIYKTLFQTMAEGVVMHDDTGAIVMCNPSAAEILGLTAEQLMGKSSVDPLWHTVTEAGDEFPVSYTPLW